jgi:hypothetical protein
MNLNKIICRFFLKKTLNFFLKIFSKIFQQYSRNIFPSSHKNNKKSKQVWFVLSCLHPKTSGIVMAPKLQELLDRFTLVF